MVAQEWTKKILKSEFKSIESNGKNPIIDICLMLENLLGSFAKKKKNKKFDKAKTRSQREKIRELENCEKNRIEKKKFRKNIQKKN